MLDDIGHKIVGERDESIEVLYLRLGVFDETSCGKSGMDFQLDGPSLKHSISMVPTCSRLVRLRVFVKRYLFWRFPSAHIEGHTRKAERGGQISLCKVNKSFIRRAEGADYFANSWRSETRLAVVEKADRASFQAASLPSSNLAASSESSARNCLSFLKP